MATAEIRDKELSMRLVNFSVRCVEAICCFLIVVMVVVTFIQVVNRFIFQSAFFWAEECAILTMIWIAFMGSAIAARKGMHTRIDFLINMLAPKAKQAIETVNYLLMAAFVAALGYYSLPIIKVAGRQITTGMKIPRSVIYYSILAGCICMGVYLVLLAACKALGRDPDGRGNA
jgi:TRAP-type C4-dicarboxylate transport system permease small subunit